MRISLPIFTVLALSACGGGSTPQDLVNEYAQALEGDNANRAYNLTSPEYRSANSVNRFESEFGRRVEAGSDLTDALREAADGDASLTARADYSDYESVELEYRGDRWVITGGVGVFFSQETPRDTLITFIRAVKGRDTGTMLRLVPGEFRSRIDSDSLEAWMDIRAAELAETLALLEASVDSPIREREDTATLRYGAREMRFIREGSRWVIEDFE
jgi:hypothetical protein